MKEGQKRGCTEAGIWVSNPLGDDFQVDLPQIPRVGEVFRIGGRELKVASIVYHPLTIERGKLNKCAVEIVLGKMPSLADGYSAEQLWGTAT
jgi:hypothetical protein